jgi:hypothetical protein
MVLIPLAAVAGMLQGRQGDATALTYYSWLTGMGGRQQQMHESAGAQRTLLVSWLRSARDCVFMWCLYMLITNMHQRCGSRELSKHPTKVCLHASRRSNSESLRQHFHAVLHSVLLLASYMISSCVVLCCFICRQAAAMAARQHSSI